MLQRYRLELGKLLMVRSHIYKLSGVFTAFCVDFDLEKMLNFFVFVERCSDQEDTPDRTLLLRS